jgi:hypothetical protein
MEEDNVEDLIFVGEDYEDEPKDLDEEYCPLLEEGTDDNNDDDALLGSKQQKEPEKLPMKFAIGMITCITFYF